MTETLNSPSPPGGALAARDLLGAAGIVPEQKPSLLDLEDFFENGAIALHLVASDGRILRANKAELALLGYAPEEYIGRHIAEFHVDQPVIEDILARLSRGEKIEKYPARLRAKDGSIKHVEITSSVQFRKGKFINTRCFTVDVTELRRTQAALAEKQRHLEQILEALPAAVYTTDAAGKITYFNKMAVDLAGRVPEIGKDEWCITWRLRRPDGTILPHEQCPMAIALKEKRPVRGVEALLERPDGRLIPFVPFPTPIHGADGKLIGAVNMLVDVSERKDAEAQQRMLLSELNHRVKNNLQMLFSLLNQARRSANSEEARLVLSDAARRVAAMSAAQQSLYDARKPNSLSCADFVEAVSEAAMSTFDKRPKINVERVSGELKNEVVTPLALILNELLTNAVKHGGAEPSIGISLYEDGSLYALIVEDDGPGFDPQRSAPGSGLGLIDGLAHQLGGTFEVQRSTGARCEVRFVN